MTIDDLISLAIDMAVTGTDPDSNIIQKLVMEAESCVESSIHQLSAEIRADARLRARTIKEHPITLTVVGNFQVGTIPAGLLIQYLGEGAVRDSDTGASNQVGNYLSRINQEADFMAPLTPVYGYYWIGADDTGATIIKPRGINTGDFLSTVGPLVAVAPRTPSKGDIPELDSEVTDRLVEIVAVRLRGFIPGVEQAA